jgi:predicted dehydrogenase
VALTAPLRFGIVSFAHFHANFWAQAINDTERATLVGVWDDDVQRGQAAAEQHQTRFFPDLNALLAECDAVGITSETAKHAPLVETAAVVGVHVLLEKPMARTTAECARIVRAVNESGITFMQNFP